MSEKLRLVGLTRAPGVEWARYSINVNILSPGYHETDIIKYQIAIGQLDLDAIVCRTPITRLGTIEDLPALPFSGPHTSPISCAGRP